MNYERHQMEGKTRSCIDKSMTTKWSAIIIHYIAGTKKMLYITFVVSGTSRLTRDHRGCGSVITL